MLRASTNAKAVDGIRRSLGNPSPLASRAGPLVLFLTLTLACGGSGPTRLSGKSGRRTRPLRQPYLQPYLRTVSDPGTPLLETPPASRLTASTSGSRRAEPTSRTGLSRGPGIRAGPYATGAILRNQRHSVHRHRPRHADARSGDGEAGQCPALHQFHGEPSEFPEQQRRLRHGRNGSRGWIAFADSTSRPT